MFFPARVRFVLLGCLLATAGLAADFPRKKVLFFSKASGFEHDAIKLKLADGRPGFAFAVLQELGEKYNIEFTFSKDGSLFSDSYLAQFDAYFFYTSGDLTLAKNDEKRGDGNPPMTAEGKAAFLRAIEQGKGFVGTHSATDTFHPPGNKDHGPARFQSDGDRVDPYGKMIGASFIKHGAQQPARMILVDPRFPGMEAIGADFGPHEEWYSLKNFSPDLHVLLVQETAGMKGSDYERPRYPATWARLHGRGRVFYTSMGHREDIWTSPAFKSVLAGGLNWALGRVDADVTPNIDRVTPQANTLPPYLPPPPFGPGSGPPAATGKAPAEKKP
ncbi:MAG: ThuA domain-containing protein [Opitutaceae bacterium]|nr:ThuA domain-containing protein [Opitutaceae bacterium]